MNHVLREKKVVKLSKEKSFKHIVKKLKKKYSKTISRSKKYGLSIFISTRVCPRFTIKYSFNPLYQEVYYRKLAAKKKFCNLIKYYLGDYPKKVI